MLENDFDSDILDLTAYFGDFFFLYPELEKEQEEIFRNMQQIDELCRMEEFQYFKSHTPKHYPRRSLLNTVSRTATITKKRSEVFPRYTSETEIKANKCQTMSYGNNGTGPFRRSLPFSSPFAEDDVPSKGNQTFTPSSLHHMNGSRRESAFFEESSRNISQGTYTCSPLHLINGHRRESAFFDESSQNLSQATYTCSPGGHDVMSTTYDKEKSDFQQMSVIDDSFGFDRLPSQSRTSSSETFTKASDPFGESAFDEQFASTGPTSLSSDDLSVSDRMPTTFNKYSTYSRLKNHNNTSRNIPLSFSSNLSSVSSVTGGSETSLYSGLRMNPTRLPRAVGSNGSQTISRGKIRVPTKAALTSAVPRQLPRASNLIKPKTLNGSRMRLPTNSSSSSTHSQASISQ